MNVSRFENTMEMMSSTIDHRLVFIEADIRPSKMKTKPTKILRYKQTKWDEFKDEMTDFITDFTMFIETDFGNQK